MKQYLRIRYFLTIAIFLLGIGLRLHQYAFMPLAGNAEEYLFVWSGLSLIEKHVPISWNDLPVYKEKDVYWRGEAINYSGRGSLGVRLLKPWLDEPPLFSLIVGGISKIYNQENFTVISPYIIRIPSLLFSFASLALVFFLTKSIFTYPLANLALLIYATVPTFVFGSRLAVAENMITPLFLGIAFLMWQYSRDEKIWRIWVSLIFVLLASFAKPTAFLLLFFVIYFLLKQKYWVRAVKVLLVGTLGFWVPYIIYGFSYDKELFLKVIKYQSQRPAGWSGLSYLITNPGFNIDIFLDGFVVLAFLSLVYLIFKKRTQKETFILFSFSYAVLMVMISGGKADQLCWYRYYIYPFASIGLALMLRKAFKKSNFYLNAFLIPLMLTNVDLLENPFWKIKWIWQVKFYRVFFLVLLLPSILFLIFQRRIIFKKLSRLSLIFAFILGIFINCWVVKVWFNLQCDHSSECALPYKIDLFKPVKNVF